MNDLLKAALDYANRGWPVFPTRSDKTPYTSNGVLDATLDAQQIRDWWTAWPRANVAIDVGASGMVVLDFDPGHDRKAVENALGEPIKETGLVQKTPRGGTHYFYLLAGKSDVISNSASKLAGNVDVRSFHGYVLLPPSKTADGEYAWERQDAPTIRQDRLRDVANSYRAKHSDRDNWIIKPDLPENVSKAIDWLKNKAKPSVEGHGGDNNAYATAAMLKSFGISQELAFDLMWEHWNPRCSPPWSSDEVDHFDAKVRNGYAYNTSPPGNCTDAYHIAKQSAGFEKVERDLPSGREVQRGRFRFVDRAGMEHIRPATWLVEDMLPEDGYAILFGGPGSLKTFLALDIACSIACGYPIDALWGDKIIEPGPVLIAIGEGRPNFRERIRAWEKRHWGGQPCPNIILADPVPPVSDRKAWEAFCDGALDLSPDGYRLKVIDTVGRAMQGVNENSQEHASAFTALVEHMGFALGGATLALHHTGLDKVDRERGSNVFRADCDTSIRVDRDEKQLLATLTMVKQKDAPEWPKPLIVKFEEVDLGDGHKSLTVVPPAPEDKPKAVAKIEEREKEKERDAAVYELLDHAVAQVLKAYPGRDFTQIELAELLAAREEISIGSKSLQNRFLTPLRERKDLRSHSFYDPAKRRWRWAHPS